MRTDSTECRIDFQSPRKLSLRLLNSAYLAKQIATRSDDDWGARTSLHCELAFGEGISLASHLGEQQAVPLVSARVAWIQEDRIPVTSFCGDKISLKVLHHKSERGMCFGELRIQ